MSTRPALLIVGSDPTLNWTRRLILQKIFSVRLAVQASDALSLLADQRFDLILLCYSLSSRDAQLISDLAHSLSPRTRILALAQGQARLHLALPDQEVLLSNPEELLKRAALMAGIELPLEKHLPPGPGPDAPLN